MRAAIYPGAGQPVVIAGLPDPVPAPGEVVIRVDRCGICGTDLSMTKGEPFDFGTNVQFGHEYAGAIVAAGENAQGWKAGVSVSIACSPSATTRPSSSRWPIR